MHIYIGTKLYEILVHFDTAYIVRVIRQYQFGVLLLEGVNS